MGKKTIDFKTRRVASRGRKSKAGGGEKNQKRLNYIHPCFISRVISKKLVSRQRTLTNDGFTNPSNSDLTGVVCLDALKSFYYGNKAGCKWAGLNGNRCIVFYEVVVVIYVKQINQNNRMNQLKGIEVWNERKR